MPVHIHKTLSATEGVDMYMSDLMQRTRGLESAKYQD
jgi:hypothetical protein